MINFNKICRTCSSEGELQSLFVEDPILLADMLNQIVDVKVNKDDNFPQNICTYCLEKLKTAYYFVQQCHNVNIKLKEYMENGVEITEIDIKNESIEEYKEDFSSYTQLEFLVDGEDFIGETEDIKSDNSEDIDNSDKNSSTKKKVKLIECDICLKTLRRGNFRRHLKTHTGDRPHECSFCDKRFIQKTELEAHVRKHTGEKPFNCNHCEKSFKQRIQLFYHIKVKHSEEIKPSPAGKFVCDICEEKFSNQLILSSHKLLHKKITPKSHLCNHCGKAFYSNSKLQEHIRIHTGEKHYKCEICNKTFSLYSVLYSHRKTHSLEKPYKCSFCEKLFSTKLTLNVHELIHTGDKPFKCEICNQRFRQRNHLKYHSYTHTGEKQYKCTFCDKQFALKGNLTVHQRTHTGETPYVCIICGKGFYESSSLKRHRLKKHLIVDNVKTEQVSN